MRTRHKRLVRRILIRLRLTPLSLAAKCRIMFGAAVALSLVIALLIPYIWMRQLTRKVLLDTNRGKAEALLLRSHFRVAEVGEIVLPQLDASGSAVDPNRPQLTWVRFSSDSTDPLSQFSADQQKIVGWLREQESRYDNLTLRRDGGVLASDYVRLFKAADTCLGCHNPQGTAGAFALNELIGVAAIYTRGIGPELRWTIILNRVWVIVAGLIGGTGALIAFYWITQRVILRPIRQLRAMANNVAEGNLAIRSSIATGDEYEKLARAFNHMLDRLEGAHEKLREANRQLDAKIAELSERNIELFKANKLKSEFLANMSHEFRTPLNAILGFAQVLRDKPTLLRRDKGQRYAENIISSGNSLLTMINDLLDLAKAEAGKMELHIERASVSQLCESIVSAFTLLARKKRIRLKLQVEPDVPLLTTDAGKVQQILYNFLSNGIKFTPPRGQVDIHARVLDEKTVRIAVRDTGCGIAKAHQEKIFEKFRQADGSLTRESTGSGLGLTISQELATMLAGSIGLESEAGEGSVFWLDIPITLTGPESPSPEQDHPAGV